MEFLSHGNLRNHPNELKIPVGIIITGIGEIYAEKLIILRLSHSPGHPTPMAGERDARPTFGGEVGLRMESTNGRININTAIFINNKSYSLDQVHVSLNRNLPLFFS